jgi:hypothetical protein
MTKLSSLYILLLGLTLFCSCSNRGDILLNASDELHYIMLFEKDKKFKLCHNGINTAVGKYEFKEDTFYLTYTKNKILTQIREGKKYSGTENEFLTRKLIIDNATKRIHSLDGRNFCAIIKSNKFKSRY